MKYLATTLLAAGLAAAHGWIDNGTIDGISYTFYQPTTDPFTVPPPDRVSRPVQGNGPVMDVEIADVQCGGFSDGGIVGSSPAKLHAPATAGSDITLFWTLWPDSHFGALITYMARCPDEGCQDFMPNDAAVWFKIDEAGMLAFKGGGDLNDWAVDPLMVNGNAGYTFTIPPCLADGFYLVRHEIISVFTADVYPGAQVYPGCHQLELSGGGSTTVPADNLVSFPGAYSPTDPGITWKRDEETYPIPGPAVFSCDGADSGGSAPPGGNTAAKKSAAPKSEAPAAPTEAPTAASVKALTQKPDVAAAAATPAPTDEDDACTRRKKGSKKRKRNSAL